MFPRQQSARAVGHFAILQQTYESLYFYLQQKKRVPLIILLKKLLLFKKYLRNATTRTPYTLYFCLPKQNAFFYCFVKVPLQILPLAMNPSAQRHARTRAGGVAPRWHLSPLGQAH